MEELHERLLRIGFEAGSELGLVLAGGYALAAHDLVDRPSQDIDLATGTALPMPHIVERLAAAYEAASYAVQIIEGTPRMHGWWSGTVRSSARSTFLRRRSGHHATCASARSCRWTTRWA
jgi:hypothetical protein